MRLYSWNVNGIRAVIKKELFYSFIEEHKPDVLCLQEIKANEEQVDIELPGYELNWNSADRKGYSGTAIFSKIKVKDFIRNIPTDIEEEFGLHDDPYGNPNTEGRVSVGDYGDFYIVTVYTPNSKGDLSRLPLRDKKWDPAFLAYMDRLQQVKPVYFSGDLNVAHTEIDLARPKENIGKHGFTNEERAGFDKILETGFHDTFRKFHEGDGHYSWWTHWGKARDRNVGWRIDYWLAGSDVVETVEDANIHADVMGSDHCPVSCIIKT